MQSRRPHLALAYRLLLVFVLTFSALWPLAGPPASLRAAPPDKPPPPTPAATSTPQASEPGVSSQGVTPPSPEDLPPEAEQARAQQAEVPLYPELMWHDIGFETKTFTLNDGLSVSLPGSTYQSEEIEQKLPLEIITYYSPEHLSQFSWNHLGDAAGTLMVLRTYFKEPNRYLNVQLGGCNNSQMPEHPSMFLTSNTSCIRVWISSPDVEAPVPVVPTPHPTLQAEGIGAAAYQNPLPVPYFSQNDETWKADTLGWPDSGYPNGCYYSTLGYVDSGRTGYGCWTTSYAMLYNYYKSNHTNPQILNNNLNTGPGGGPRYADNPESHCNNYMPHSAVYGPPGVSWNDQTYNNCSQPNCIDTSNVQLIDSEINSGRPLLAYVHFSGVNPQHAVLIVGHVDKNYYINDPWDGQPHTLSAGALGAYTVDWIYRWNGTPPDGGSTSGCDKYSDTGIVLFDTANCSGSTKKFYQTGFANLNDFNDAATSIYVPSSWSVRVYEHADRGGASRCIDHTMWDLNQDYYDNSSTKIAGTISSVDVFNNSTCSGTPPPPPTDKVRLYSEANFGGSEVWNGGVGFSNGPSANSYSMKVPSGWSVKTWSQDDRVGDYRCWTGSVNNLQDHGWQLKIQSVEVNSSIACPTPPPPGGQWTAKYYPTRTCWDDHSQCTGNYTYSENLSVPGNSVIIDKNWGTGSPGGSTPNDNWTGFFEATLNFNTGSYVFYADHDDGLKLNIEGYGEHNKDSSGSSSRLCHGDDGYYLSGSKNIKVYLREDGGDARIKIWYDNNTAACRKPDPPTLWAPGNQTTTSDTTPTFSWLSVSGATEYNIQVDNNSNFSSPEVNNQKTSSTTYTPSSALAVGTYYWRVQTKNQYNNWGDWSSTWQVTIVTIPSIPANVQASDGVYTDKVRVTWNAVSGATGYEVWRHTSSSSSSAIRIAYSVTGTSYDDTGAVSGQTYYYWIRACNASVCSGYSNYDTGWRNVAPPTNVQASDGTYTDKVRVTWNAVSGATGYEVWRHTSNNSSSATRMASSVTGTSYDDTGAVSGPTYYYWIKAKTPAGASGFSVPNSGYRASAPEEYRLFLPLLLKGQ
jgi:hypothetical protein